MYYETSFVFYIPSPLARGYKTHNEFNNTSYGMKIYLRFFSSHELTRNQTDDALTLLCRCYTLRTSLRCAVLLQCEEGHISLFLKIKHNRKSILWWNNKSKCAIWFLTYIHECVMICSDMEESYFACTDLYVTCCYKIYSWHGFI